MRPRILIAGLALTLAGSLAAPARAEDGYRHGRVRLVEPGVSLQRASGVGAEEADTNEPFLPGDRVWTNGAGRAEFQFPDGSLIRLDLRSKLDYAGHEERDGERIVLRLWSGSVYLRVRAREARFEIETPAGTVRGLERSLLRVDADGGEVRVSVYEGEGLFDDGQTSMRLTAGERTYVRWGEGAEDPRPFDLDEEDAFARWNGELDAEDRWDGRSARYLPDELDSYASEFDSYGDWRYETTVGYVWVPRVEVGWRPYWHGRWCWTPFGWTWVPYERWGWAPSHYGRWGHGGHGWYWIPGRSWGPAWVSWAVGDGYVGWCPLGWRDRPVRDWNHRQTWRDRGHAVPRGGRVGGEIEAWNVVRQGELGHRDLAKRRVSIDRINPAALRVAESARLRPTRDALRLQQGATIVRPLNTRPAPGDFVRELAVDNKTTIRAPWFRGGAVPRDESRIGGERAETAASTRGALRRGSGEAGGASRSRDAQVSSQRSDRRVPESAERNAPRPWSGPEVRPRAREQAPRVREQAPPATSTWRETGRRPREVSPAPETRVTGGEVQRSRGGEVQRSRGGEMQRSRGGEAQRPRSDGATTSRQRETSGGGRSRPSGDSAAARPQGGSSRSSSGEARSSGGRTQGGASAQRRGRR